MAIDRLATRKTQKEHALGADFLKPGMPAPPADFEDPANLQKELLSHDRAEEGEA